MVKGSVKYTSNAVTIEVFIYSVDMGTKVGAISDSNKISDSIPRVGVNLWGV
jgi:hypothetical protein